ncbi:MAG TPA: methyltransferase domain-containing protein [Solirubrobacterales bacterium]|nr:methyltransferase domain-containing protein [Solirubrobacterales bacterium]
MVGRLAIGAAAGIAGALWWWRKNPSACPYGQRLFVDVPHPLITRRRLREALAPAPGERVLEIGPGTGYYTLDLARWVGPDGRVDVFDIQREFLDHTIERARGEGLDNVHPAQGDARSLAYGDNEFDACVLITVLGEVPDQDVALREVARVLTPGGRLVVGELALDPHYVSPAALARRGDAAGLRLEERLGPAVGYFARLRA